MTRPTIRDVAREAGVGLGTVSRVLGGGTRVSGETRRRVEAAIARLGFRPSPSARALSRGRTQTIEVVAPLRVRPYYLELLAGLAAGLAETDYGLNLRLVESLADRDRAFAGVDRRGYPDGVVVVRMPPTPDLTARLQSHHVPVVLVDVPGSPCPGVAVDHAAAAAGMTRHVLSLGHRRVALIDRQDDPFDQAVLDARRAGYRRALAEAGIAPEPRYEPPSDWSAAGGATALAVLLALPDPPTAVVTGSDTQAIGVLEGARRRGLRVPGDLAVCGYGDVELAEYLRLTTVRVPIRQLGARAISRLADAIEGRDEATGSELLSGELVVRGTCGAPKRP